MTDAVTCPAPGRLTILAYKRTLRAVQAARWRDIERLARIVSSATGDARGRIDAWLADQADGFRLLVVDAAAREPFAGDEHGQLNRAAIDAVEDWLTSEVSAANVSTHLAAVLIFEDASTELLSHSPAAADPMPVTMWARPRVLWTL